MKNADNPKDAGAETKPPDDEVGGSFAPNIAHKSPARTRKDEERRPPDARVVFREGGYDAALRDYFAAREWLLSNGAAKRRDLCGIIRSPAFKGMKVPGGIIPQHWLEENGWQTVVDFWFAEESALVWLRGQSVPSCARLEEL